MRAKLSLELSALCQKSVNWYVFSLSLKPCGFKSELGLIIFLKWHVKNIFILHNDWKNLYSFLEYYVLSSKVAFCEFPHDFLKIFIGDEDLGFEVGGILSIQPI